MKAILSALLTLMCFAANAQTPALQKLWVGDNKLYFKAYNDSALCFQSIVVHVIKLKDREVRAIWSDQSGRYQLSGNRLHLSGGWFSEAGGDDFLIDTSAKDKLILTPVNAHASGFMESLVGTKQAKYVFKEVHRVSTDSIKLEKIVYKIKGGYPSVRTTIYELGVDGKLRLFKEKWQYRGAVGINIQSMPDANDEYFTAVVPKAVMKQLTDILKLSEFDKLPEKGNQNIDITDRTIELYYNHKVKYITAGWMPFVAQPLDSFLWNLSRKIDLKPSTEKFDIALVSEAKKSDLH